MKLLKQIIIYPSQWTVHLLLLRRWNSSTSRRVKVDFPSALTGKRISSRRPFWGVRRGRKHQSEPPEHWRRGIPNELRNLAYLLYVLCWSVRAFRMWIAIRWSMLRRPQSNGLDARVKGCITSKVAVFSHEVPLEFAHLRELTAQGARSPDHSPSSTKGLL